MVTEEQIFQIETQEFFGEFIVRRVNITDLEVIKDGIVIFKGEDYEVAEFINEERG
ncbi:hypothetical protein [Halalkalibacterium halodurans]|uniref:hypothetical protein n=1 Tax=Halalkalibacterium halodurans TaxID=86665 RepID=UPI00141A30A4|nr:hypothetical protein [Halalkalibacterium halodurans]